jgi:hypothetical protein
VDNIKMDLKETGWGVMDSIELAQDRDQGRESCEHVTNPSDYIMCWEV